jgi:hypothetical protein
MPADLTSKLFIFTFKVRFIYKDINFHHFLVFFFINHIIIYIFIHLFILNVILCMYDKLFIFPYFLYFKINLFNIITF